jgi:hypothetical protein
MMSRRWRRTTYVSFILALDSRALHCGTAALLRSVDPLKSVTQPTNLWAALFAPLVNLTIVQGCAEPGAKRWDDHALGCERPSLIWKGIAVIGEAARVRHN